MAEPVFWSEQDADMERAAAKARATFRYFWRELSWEARRIVPATDLAAVKAMFVDGERIEQMWIGDVDFDGQIVSGTLLNAPNWIRNLQQGDVVAVPFGERVTDWMLSMSERVYGAFTVNLLRARMSDDERVEHDQAWGLAFGDPQVDSIPHADSLTDERDHPMAVNMRESFMTFLREHPSEISKADDRGWTLLHREALAGNAPMIEILLAQGADKQAKTVDGKTPAALAQEMGWTQIAARLT